MNINNDTLDDIVADNDVNDQDFSIFKIICDPCLKNDGSYSLNFEMIQYYLCQYKLPISI